MKNKVAIVTGATSGLGRAYANSLASLGYDLIITGRRIERLTSIKNILEITYSVNVEIVRVDFNNKQQFDVLLKRISKLSRIDMLVNNAGYGCRDGFFQEDYRAQESMLNVHVTSATHLVHVAVPKMLKNRGGCIVNVSSLSAFLPAPLNYFYCASKLFMVSFSECLHVDMANSDIKVQALCPGFIYTEFHSRMGKESHTQSIWDSFLWMKAEEVVDYSLKSLGKHKVICIPGWVNRVVFTLSHILPKQICYWLTKKKIGHESKALIAA